MSETVRITATQKFLHEDGRYAKGKTYDVDPELADYFVASGWATSDQTVAPRHGVTTDLDIHSTVNGHRAELKG